MITNDLTTINAGYDPRKRPWYLDGLKTPGKGSVAKAYLSTNGEYVTAVVKAVTSGGSELKAVAGIDISLKRLTDTKSC